MWGCISYYNNLVRVSISVFTKNCANNLVYDARNRYVLLNLAANLDKKIP